MQSLAVARDILVSQALETGCDYILFLDTDIIFEYPTDPNSALNTLYQAVNKDKSNKDVKIVQHFIEQNKRLDLAMRCGQKLYLSDNSQVQCLKIPSGLGSDGN